MFGVIGLYLIGVIQTKVGKVEVPCHIMGFLDLCALPPNFDVRVGGLDQLIPGTYAIVQCAEYESTKERYKGLIMFKRLNKVVGGVTDGRVSHLDLYLAPVGAIVREVTVIPDMGGPPNGYFE